VVDGGEVKAFGTSRLAPHYHFSTFTLLSTNDKSIFALHLAIHNLECPSNPTERNHIYHRVAGSRQSLLGSGYLTRSHYNSLYTQNA
jgi:hypothetical protein